MCFDLPSTNADITLPSADNDRFILVASLKRSPVAPITASVIFYSKPRCFTF